MHQMQLTGHVMVIDDFFERPDEIRRFALALPFVAQAGAPYAGAQTTRGYYGPAILDRFEKLVGSRPLFDPGKDVFGNFRLSLAGDEGTTRVHFDNTQWAGLIYLSAAASARSNGMDGTLFFRHRVTGKLGPEVPISSSDWAPHRAELVRAIIERDSKRLEAWELVHRVPLKFNRLVLFQGWRYFHAAGLTFGDSTETGRLTQNFFFGAGERS